MPEPTKTVSPATPAVPANPKAPVQPDKKTLPVTPTIVKATKEREVPDLLSGTDTEEELRSATAKVMAAQITGDTKTVASVAKRFEGRLGKPFAGFVNGKLKD